MRRGGDTQARVSESKDSRTREVVAMVQGVSIQNSRQEQVGVGMYPGCLVLTGEEAKRLFSDSLDRLLRDYSRVLACLV